MSSWLTSSTRPQWFVVATCIVTFVNDGYSGKPSPLIHQLILLPISATFLFSAVRLWSDNGARESERRTGRALDPYLVGSLSQPWFLLLLAFEVVSLAGMVYERRHFARFGYGFTPVAAMALTLLCGLVALYAIVRKTSAGVLATVAVLYASGLAFAVACFPLNYLRSDMLPVIIWADGRLIGHLNPYVTMHVGARVYDFPYLPGMLLAFLPAIAVHLDVRIISMACCLLIAAVLYFSAHEQQRMMAATLIGVFLLCPFLQYRHDLYLEPHWLVLTASIVLLRYRRYGWAALLFGVSMALYQLSWVLFPFLVLFAWRRHGWLEALKAAVLGLGGMLLVMAPFLRSATKRIASNTVGQWSSLPHALADPINLSYWLTYLVRPDQLKWVQLVVMAGIFGYCVFRQRCETLVDTLRWMSVALTFFIMLNVLVDGYFYLTLLLLLLMYTFAATGLWPALEAQRNIPKDESRG